MEQIKEFADRYLTQIQFIGPMDIVEIILISLMVYYLLIFIRNTRAWQLLKGVFVILVFLVIAEILADGYDPLDCEDGVSVCNNCADRRAAAGVAQGAGTARTEKSDSFRHSL